MRIQQFYYKLSHGVGLIGSFMVLILISGVVAVFNQVVLTDIATLKFTKDSVSGFYAAESAMNIRASQVRDLFNSFSIPSGSGPSTTNPCTVGNTGSGDFACSNFTLSGQVVTTYITPEAGNPISMTIPDGEDYQGLTAQEYRYTVVAVSRKVQTNEISSQLEMRFRTRTVPLFQFLSYYNKSVEIFPGASFTLNGPIHASGDLYLVPGGTSSSILSFDGQVTASGKIYRGTRYRNDCGTGTLRAKDPNNYSNIKTCTSRVELTNTYLAPWNGMLKSGRVVAAVPPMGALDVNSSNALYSRADLRLDLKLNSSGNPDTAQSTTGIVVNNANTTKNVAATTALNGCTGGILASSRVISGSSTTWNEREGKNLRFLDVDMRGLLNCLKSTNWFTTGKLLSDTTDGGIVIHATISGPNSSGLNGYAVRLRNGSALSSNLSGAPTIKGITIISDQALYVHGDFNTVTKKSVALLTDSFNILSNSFADGTATNSRTVSANMTVNAAIVSGTDNTIGTDGSGSIDSGGLTIFPRLHENWTNRTLTIVGSLVSLGAPRHVDGVVAVGMPQYTPPIRAWSYDVSFNNPANLPPMSLQLVYLKEELFLRDFTQ